MEILRFIGTMCAFGTALICILTIRNMCKIMRMLFSSSFRKEFRDLTDDISRQ